MFQKEEHELLVLKLLSCLGELADIQETEFPTRRSLENLCEQFVEKRFQFGTESFLMDMPNNFSNFTEYRLEGNTFLFELGVEHLFGNN